MEMQQVGRPRSNTTISGSSFSPVKGSPPSSTKRKLSLSYLRLSNARIVQRCLVYVINLPVALADELLLKSYEYLGQYGSIVKCVVNKQGVHSTSNNPTCSAHVTYNTEEESSLCIKACNGFEIHGKELKMYFGTTKYCSYFSRGIACPKPNCPFLHKLASETEVVSKEELAQQKEIIPKDSKIHTIKVRYVEENTVLPALRIIRERTCSELQVPRPRLFSKDLGSPTKSRFDFVYEEEEELDAPRSPVLEGLIQNASPSNPEIEMTTEDFEEILSPLNTDPWAADLLEFRKNSLDTYLVTAKATNN